MKSMEGTALQQFTRVFSEIPFNRILGLTLDAILEDHIVISFIMKKDLIGNYMHGILHGGVISSVLDMAGGAAAMVAAIQKRESDDLAKIAAVLSKSSTVNLNVDFIRPGKGSTFTAKAYAVHSGNRITFTRMELYNQESSLIATGTATYMIG
jgi:uncharacterized protein (TIGR00369 family)